MRPVAALLFFLPLAACAPRMICETRPYTPVDSAELAAANTDDGIDKAEATVLAWHFVNLQIANEGTLCGPVLREDVWTAEFRREGLVMPMRIRIDAESGGATAPGYRAVSLSEATGH